MRFFRLLWTFFRVGAMGELAYRVNFFIQLFESLLELATAIAGLVVIFSYTASLGGWTQDQVLALVGVFFLVGGAIRFILQPSLEQLIESVRDGTLDFTLVKPEDSQLLSSIQRVELWKLTDMGLGIAVLAVALARLGERVGLLQSLEFAAALLGGPSSSTASGCSSPLPRSGWCGWRTSSSCSRACTRRDDGRSASTRAGCALPSRSWYRWALP